MSGRLSGRGALISGAESCMNASHARAFVEHGAHVVLGDIANEAGRKLAKELGDTAYVHLDVTKAQNWKAAVVETVER